MKLLELPQAGHVRSWGLSWLPVGLLAWTCLGLSASYAAEIQLPELQLVVTGSDRAIVKAGDKRYVLKKGEQRYPEISLIDADSERAVVRLNGETITLRSGAVAAPILNETYQAPAVNDNAVTLYSDSSGFFFAKGKVNRRSVRFLVDTGADTVTFSSVQADRLGLKYQNGTDGYASTASGLARLKRIKLNSVSIENITLHNVTASVILGRFPDVPLLGGSFLNQLNMTRSGKKMELRK